MASDEWADRLRREIERVVRATEYAPVRFADPERVRAGIPRIGELLEDAGRRDPAATERARAEAALARLFAVRDARDELFTGDVGPAGRPAALARLVSRVSDEIDRERDVRRIVEETVVGVRRAGTGLPPEQLGELETLAAVRVESAAEAARAAGDGEDDLAGAERARRGAAAERARIDEQLRLERDAEERRTELGRDVQASKMRRAAVVAGIIAGYSFAEAFEAERSRERDEKRRLALERTEGIELERRVERAAGLAL